MTELFRNTPRGATVIDESGLSDIIKEVISVIPVVNGVMDISRDEIFNSIYSLTLVRLRENRFFFVGLNNQIVTDLLQSVTSSLKFKEIPSKLSQQDKSLEFDDIIWKKVNGLEYDKVRLSQLKREFNIDEHS